MALCSRRIEYIIIEEMNLPVGTLLQGGRYKIEKVLGQGTFGITYQAEMKVQGKLGPLDFHVAIKEFFMKEKNERRSNGSVTCSQSSAETCEYYRKKFRHEAENLSKMRHGNIVKVNDVFDENNTSYYVMELVAGGSLDSYIDERHGLPEGEALRILRETGSAISYMHSKRMLHLDIKPNNIMRRYDGHIFLIDFGLSKQFNKNGEPESSTHVGLGTPGYAPHEQSGYKPDGSFPTTLDVYALGATLYKMLTGSKPPYPSDIIDYGLDRHPLEQKNVSKATIAVIEKAMEPKKAERYQSVAEMLSALPVIKSKEKEEEPEVIDISEEDTPKTKDWKKDDENKKKFKTYAIGAIALVIIIVAALFLFPKHDKPDTTNIVPIDSILSVIPDSLKSQNAQSLSSTDSGSSVREESKVTVNPTLTLSCKTSGASLYVDGNKKGTDKWSGELSAGTHKIEARLDGYQTEAETLSLANGGTYSHTFPALIAIEKKSEPVATTANDNTSLSSSSGTINGHEYVDLGLSVKWATCNVGASSPTGYGNYYAWGETITKSEYTKKNSKTYGKIKSMGDISGNSSYDAARANWGGTWRLPTVAECKELLDCCNIDWMTVSGANGWKFTSNKNGKSIFLPAAGSCGSSLYDVGQYGYYWSGSRCVFVEYAYVLRFDNGKCDMYRNYRYVGISVRPVSD